MSKHGPSRSLFPWHLHRHALENPKPGWQSPSTWIPVLCPEGFFGFLHVLIRSMGLIYLPTWMVDFEGKLLQVGRYSSFMDPSWGRYESRNQFYDCRIPHVSNNIHLESCFLTNLTISTSNPIVRWSLLHCSKCVGFKLTWKEMCQVVSYCHTFYFNRNGRETEQIP